MSFLKYLFGGMAQRQASRTRRKMDRSLWKMIFGGDY